MRRTLTTIAVAVFLGACSTHVQTTSGADYLARGGAVTAAPETIMHRTPLADGAESVETITITSTDELVRRAAAIEPILTLPARIGLARIERGQLTIIPAHEAEIWNAVAARFPGLGTVIPVDPFLAEYTARDVLPQDRRRLRDDAGDIITKIRLGSARQHLNAVLIYEVGMRARSGSWIEGMGSIRVLGGVAPGTTAVKPEGLARAILLDVRNGYPYATISASADLTGAKPGIWQSDGEARAYAEASRRIVRALSGEVALAFRQIVATARRRVASK